MTDVQPGKECTPTVDCIDAVFWFLKLWRAAYALVQNPRMKCTRGCLIPTADDHILIVLNITYDCGADALDNVPLALAENSGLAPIDSLTEVKSRQLAEGNPHLGIDCNDVGTNDMREQNVFETLSSKKQQLFLATQVCKMILKIDDVIQPSQYD